MHFGWLRLSMAVIGMGAVGSIVASGCGSSDGGSDKKPPPSPTGGFGVGGAPVAPLTDGEICQCIFSIGGPDVEGTPAYECATCRNNALENECQNLDSECKADLLCDDYFQCLTDNQYAPEALESCGAYPFDGPSAELFRRTYACTCNACADKCNEYPTPSCTVEINDPTNWQCIIDSVDSPTCQACVTAQQNDVCADEYMACLDDPSDGCASSLDLCLPECANSSDQADCVQACLGAEGSPSRLLAEAYYECLCTSPTTCYDACSGDASGCGDTGGGGMGGMSAGGMGGMSAGGMGGAGGSN